MSRRHGQKGTTEPWQNPARVLTGIHGPCWLAAEIAIAGAANRSLLASGSFDKGGEPFGPHVDYGTFVLAVHNRPDLDWWGSMYERYPDSLSRRTWALALITCADTDVVAHYLASIDSTWSALNNDEFYAVASSSSRLALSQSRRQLDDTIWDSAHGLGQRTLLLVAHFAADLAAADPLTVLSDEQLEQLASPMVATWPVARAINTRMFSTPNATLLSALSKLGAGPLGDAPQGAKFDPDENTQRRS